jgi:hypothetical protein
MKRSRYDQLNNRAQLESIRESLEKQIYLLNDKMLQSENRWKDVNHLLLRKEYIENSSDLVFTETPKLNNFLKSNGISEKDLLIDKKLVFLLTPFNNEFNEEFYVIKNVCQEVGLFCVRGDEKFLHGDIFPEMLRNIVKANLIIANINGRNPNVLYELGIAQALDKPVILISKQPENLPIDIKSKRFLIYKNFAELKLMLRNEVIKALTR